MTPPRRVLALVPELMVAVRIQEAARSLGAEAAVVESREELAALLDPADVLVIDLGAAGVDVPGAVTQARARGVEVIAFGPHVDAGGLREARRAGVRRLYPRGKFLANLRPLLGEALAARR